MVHRENYALTKERPCTSITVRSQLIALRPHHLDLVLIEKKNRTFHVIKVAIPNNGKLLVKHGKKRIPTTKSVTTETVANKHA